MSFPSIAPAPSSLAPTAPGLTRSTRRAVGDVHAPLVRLGVVEAQRQEFEVTRRTVELDLPQIGAAIPESPHHAAPVVLDPGGASPAPLQPAPHVHRPPTDRPVTEAS